jgi:putative heme iron utilization protein
MAEEDRRSASAVNALEACRAIAAQAKTGALATVGAAEIAGWPYASLVNVAWDAQGRALLLLSSLAEHTKNLRARPEASLLVAEAVAPSADPLAAGRMTIVGTCALVPEADDAAARAAFLAAHPSAQAYIGFKDFRLYRLEPAKTRYVGGFGRMAWV